MMVGDWRSLGRSDEDAGNWETVETRISKLKWQRCFVLTLSFRFAKSNQRSLKFELQN